MNNFDYVNRTRIVFGKDEENRIGEILHGYGYKKVLLHYGKSSVKKSGLLDRVIASLTAVGIDYVELGGVAPNPKLTLARRGVEIVKADTDIDCILAVGGGSVIDSAKAIAAGRYYDGDVWDFYALQTEVKGALPLATVLTIPAAGSESSNATVITNESEGRKLSFGSEHVRPIVSVVNPELFFTLPKNQIANGVVDMLCHVMERYFTNTKCVQLTDGMCESVMRTIMRNGVKLIEKPHDYDLWAEIAFAGTVAHNGLIGMGREEDWASHDIEHELSALYDIAHGTGLAIISPAWMKYVYRENIDMFAMWAVNVMDVRPDLKDKEGMVLEAIAKLERFYRELGEPIRLSEIGISSEHFDEMAEKATTFLWTDEKTLGGFKKLDKRDIINIYKLAQ